MTLRAHSVAYLWLQGGAVCESDVKTHISTQVPEAKGRYLVTNTHATASGTISSFLQRGLPQYK